MEEEKNQRWWEKAPAYILAYEDVELLNRDELRPVRLMLEYFKPELILAKNNVKSTVVVFGGTRIIPRDEAETQLQNAKNRLDTDPVNEEYRLMVRRAEKILEKSKYYDEAREFSQIVSRAAQTPISREFVVTTGGGPGIMEASNRGAHDVNAVSIGLNIKLPREQHPNRFITPEFCFRFHYFALRKLHFMKRAKALVAFPGGYGTLDELFDALTLIQTKIVKPLPVILFGEKFWRSVINFETLVEEGTVDPEDVHLFKFAETAEEAWNIITDFYENENTD